MFTNNFFCAIIDVHKKNERVCARGENMNIKETIGKMTLQEKAAILTGKDFWQTLDFDALGIKSIFLSTTLSIRRSPTTMGKDITFRST